VTFALPSSTRLIALSAATLGAVLLLTGCAGGGPSVDQDVTVTYLTAGEAFEVTVEIPQVRCSDLAGTLLYSADGENGRDDWGLLRASATADRDSYTVSVGLGDGLWFVSTNEYDHNDSSITLNELEGLVAPIQFENGVSDFGTTIDAAATATGTLSCTS